MGAHLLGFESSLRVLFWGPPGSGKKTNIEVLHDRTPPELSGRLVSVRALGDRTILFERGWRSGGLNGGPFRMHFFAISGPDVHDSNLRRLLEEVDGVVHVVGAEEDAAERSRGCRARLDAGMAAVGRRLADLPQVFQFNQRDRAAARPLEALRGDVETGDHPWCEATAIRGEGVVESVGLLVCGMGEDWTWEGTDTELAFFRRRAEKRLHEGRPPVPSTRATPAVIPDEVEFYRPTGVGGAGPLDLIPHR